MQVQDKVSCCIIPIAKKETGVNNVTHIESCTHLYLVLLHSLLVQAEDMLVPGAKVLKDQQDKHSPRLYSKCYLHTLYFAKI